jgi:hypothetical protein
MQQFESAICDQLRRSSMFKAVKKAIGKMVMNNVNSFVDEIKEELDLDHNKQKDIEQVPPIVKKIFDGVCDTVSGIDGKKAFEGAEKIGTQLKVLSETAKETMTAFDQVKMQPGMKKVKEGVDEAYLYVKGVIESNADEPK